MATLGGLIHVFNILETQRLKKYTAYKIQMISFPKNENLFQSLTKLTVTKRYSDFKTLESNLYTTYKSYNFKTFFKSDKNFFNRFDPEVIEQRKRTILEFLYYCAEHSVLYRSQYFVKFFDDSNSKCEIEDICDNSKPNEESPEESINSFEEEISEEVLEADQSQVDIDYYLCGYLYDAALNFSHAVQEEANLRYKNAFELYKSGIDKLLTGAKNDNNEMRKRIAKTKASKYLEKAEKLYENYILEEQENEFLIKDIDTKETQRITSLECPLSQLSRYKVLQVNKRIMKVQDRTDKKIYIMKVIWKSHSHNALFMPQNIPFMCSLLSYFHSENTIFLLLPYVSGGLLWDYVNNYSASLTKNTNLEEIFVEPPIAQSKPSTNTEGVENIVIHDLQKVLDDYNDHEIDTQILSNEGLENADTDIFTPSLDTVSPDIDIDDLMKCSQKLLKSVTKTLEKSVFLSTESKIEVDSAMHESKTIDENKVVEESPVTLSNIPQTKPCDHSNGAKILHDTSIPEFILKRWAVELIICVNSLHKNGIIIGDLNLDNILLGPNGHILLTYCHQNSRNAFKQICELNQNALKCYYVAFEFPLTKNSDYYSMGVVLYEIFTKNRFFIQHPQGISKFNEIQYNDESCDLSETSKDLLDVLIFRKFDNDSPYECIKTHPFFDGIDFNDVESFGYE